MGRDPILLVTVERDFPWGTLRSRFASKVKLVLEEKRLAYRIENLEPDALANKGPERFAAHPLGMLPCIRDGDVRVFDSTVIAEYLEERYPARPLLPREVLERARARELEQFGDEGIIEDPLLELVSPYWTDDPGRHEAQLEQARERLRNRSLPFLETTLAGSRAGFLAGDFSLADVPCAVLAWVLEVDGMPLDEFPRVSRYLDRLRGRPSYRAISPRTRVAEAASGPASIRHGDSTPSGFPDR